MARQGAGGVPADIALLTKEASEAYACMLLEGTRAAQASLAGCPAAGACQAGSARLAVPSSHTLLFFSVPSAPLSGTTRCRAEGSSSSKMLMC